MQNNTEPYKSVREHLAKSDFRSRFKLTDPERAYIAMRGWDVLHAQTVKIITERLAPANPPQDGKQTPMRGHPVFKAQHGTASCCRGCLEKWHHIPKGQALSPEEIEWIVQLILGWLREKAGDLSGYPVTPNLF